MGIDVPHLDDRTYTDLVDEARALIPGYAPDWTDHNASDPGITLIELFAWLAEMLVYRSDQVTDRQVVAFLRLLRGPDWDWTPPEDPVERRSAVAHQVRAAVVDLRAPYRAVTAEDFAARASEVEGVARAHCVPRRHLGVSVDDDRPGHVSVVVVPTDASLDDDAFDALRARVAADLDTRRVLTTQVHVSRPVTATIDVDLIAARRRDVPAGQLLDAVSRALGKVLSPAVWPLGMSVLVSELIAVLEALPEVDFVASLGVTSPQTLVAAEMWHDGGDLIGLDLGPYALPALAPLTLGGNVWTAADFVRIGADVHVTPTPGAADADVRRAVKQVIARFFHPATGGPTGGAAWGPVPVTALAAEIVAIPSVRALAAPIVVAASPAARIGPDALGDLQIRVDDGELVEVESTVRVG